MNKIKIWWEGQWQKITPEQQRRDLILDKRKNIIKCLRDDLTIDESIDLFVDIETLYKLKMNEKLIKNLGEKNKLEQFLNN